MKKFLSLLVLLFIFDQLLAQDSITSKKEATAVRISKAPRIDGKLDDEAWKNVPICNGFVQFRPIENSKPSLDTEVKIVYDNTAIYIGAFMPDNHPDSILHELGARDAEDLNSDLFYFKVDPYNTRQDGFFFGVWASGVQVDMKWLDPTFNAVWTSAVEINDKGWCVEMKVPYSAIRFPKKDIQQWGLQFNRNIRRYRELTQWVLTPSGSGNPLSYWGNLNGISNIKTPVRLSLTPYLSGYAESTPYLDHDGTIDQQNSFSYNVGADIKYGIDDRFTLDMTLLPDFGQVQSDSKIKNLGFREVTYNENRSFFKEGTDLFSKNNLFYSRRIGKTPSGFYSVYDQLEKGDSVISNPSSVKLLNATKLSGRTNAGLGIGLFNATTADMYAVVQDSSGSRRKILTEPLTNYSLLVLDQQLKNNSSIYFINTTCVRDKTFNDSNVSGAGITLFNSKNSYAFDGFGIVSQKLSKVPGESELYTDLIGYNYFFGARKSSGKIQFGASRQVRSSGIYTSDIGFQSIPNVVSNRLYIDQYQFKPNRIIREGNHSLSADYATHFVTKKTTNFEINYSGFASLLNYTAIFGGFGINPRVNLDYNEPRVEGRYAKTLRYYYGYIGFSTDYRKPIAIDLTQNMSNFIDQFKMEGYNTDVSIRYRASNKLNLKYSFSFYYDPFNVGYVTVDSLNEIIYGGRKLHTYINLLSANYLFNETMRISLVGRHYWNTGVYRKFFAIMDDGSYDSNYDYSNNHDFSYNAFNIDLVYTWIFSPGSQLTFAYKNSIEDETIFTNSKFGKNFSNTLNAPQTNSLSLKLLYFLDYLYLKRKNK